MPKCRICGEEHPPQLIYMHEWFCAQMEETRLMTFTDEDHYACIEIQGKDPKEALDAANETINKALAQIHDRT